MGNSLWLAGDQTRQGYKTSGLCDPGIMLKELKQQLCLWFGTFISGGLALAFPPALPHRGVTSVLENEFTHCNRSMYLTHAGCGVADVATCFCFRDQNLRPRSGTIPEGCFVSLFQECEVFLIRDLTISFVHLGSQRSSVTNAQEAFSPPSYSWRK